MPVFNRRTSFTPSIPPNTGQNPAVMGFLSPEDQAIGRYSVMPNQPQSYVQQDGLTIPVMGLREMGQRLSSPQFSRGPAPLANPWTVMDPSAPGPVAPTTPLARPGTSATNEHMMAQRQRMPFGSTAFSSGFSGRGSSMPGFGSPTGRERYDRRR